jgi:hypothetical protein
MARKLFVRMWIRGVFPYAIGKGDFVGSVAGNALTVAAQVSPSWQTTVNHLASQIPIYGLAGAVTARLVIAPYELWKEQRERAGKPELALCQMEVPSGPPQIVLQRTEPDAGAK